MIEAIHIGLEEAGALAKVDSVRALAGKGLEGDRNFHPEGAGPGVAPTLVEAEAVEDVGLAEGDARRQLTVRGVRLIIDDLLHRGGLRADILNDGVIRVGDAISA